MENTYFAFDFLTSAKNDDEAIASCMAAAKTVESRTVVFDRKDWLINTAILLPSHTTVIIDGCTVK